jgi:hypothetical protein
LPNLLLLNPLIVLLVSWFDLIMLCSFETALYSQWQVLCTSL